MTDPWFSTEAAFGYTLATGRLFCDVSAFHEWAERLMGVPIMTHEFGNENLWAAMRETFEAGALTAHEKGKRR